jgi:hypothetical protein
MREIFEERQANVAITGKCADTGFIVVALFL